MSHSNHDDSNLAEVKAVLGRLQRISRNRHAAGAETAEDGAALSPSQPAEPAPAGIASLIAAAPFLVKAAVSIGPVLAVAAGVAIFATGDRRPAPDKESPSLAPVAAPQEPVPASGSDRTDAPSRDAQKAPAAALQVASELLASGRVRAARDVLLRVTKEGSADVAWTLARSYDPNFLVTIRAADAAPDVAEATRWYRAWYDIAVKQGLVADSVSLDRIIRSMSSN
jgi:hypothetical protein